MPSASELIAHGRTADEVGEYIGCDWMLYQDLDDLKKSVTCFNPEITEFDTCVFDGRYVTGTVDEDYLARVDAKRNDGAMSASDPSVEDSNESADLHSKID
jgi:amidophosphoribosyltransferase